MNPKTCSFLMAVALTTISAAGAAAQAPSSTATLTRDGEIHHDEITPGYDDPKSASAPWRWIGRLREGFQSCPEIPGWTSESLRDLVLKVEDSDDQDSDDPYRPQTPLKVRLADRAVLHELERLERVCVFTATAGPPYDFTPPPGVVEAHEDRMMVAGSALEQRIWPTLADFFLLQTGRVELPPTQSSVRLVFLDSQPDDEEVPSQPPVVGSQHGYTLGHLARRLACPQGDPCAVQIAFRRALHYDRFAPPEIPRDQGGYVGLVGDLAVAIMKETLAWRSSPSAPRHLILNLSLGWNGELLDELDARRVSQLDPAAREVYRALGFARRSGVLVIAAAGNRRGGPASSKWPILPAAWELRRPSLCRLAFGRKPVYAVGGVDWQGLPLPNSRQGGRPRRVAYGDHSVARIGNPSESTAIYTGTSVSAAAASSIAAVVWHLRPELRSSQVMKLMERAGRELPDTRADFYSWREVWPLSHLLAAPHPRQVALCQAVQLACVPDGSRCPSLSPLKCDWPPLESPPLKDPLATLSGHENDYAAGRLSSAPLLIDVRSLSWLVPQPDEVPCPGCTLLPKPPNLTLGSAGSYALAFEISSEWITTAANEGLTLESGTLLIHRSGEPEPTRYAIPVSMINRPNPGVHWLLNLEAGKGLKGCTALIDFQVTKNGKAMTIHNPVVVDP